MELVYNGRLLKFEDATHYGDFVRLNLEYRHKIIDLEYVYDVDKWSKLHASLIAKLPNTGQSTEVASFETCNSIERSKQGIKFLFNLLKQLDVECTELLFYYRLVALRISKRDAHYNGYVDEVLKFAK